jgi:signal transduction histidine kinase/ligand-binding sensor protein
MSCNLKNLLDLDKLQKLFESLRAVTGIACSILGPEGEVIIRSARTVLCEKFTNHNPHTARSCSQCRMICITTMQETLQSVEGDCPLGLRYALAPLVVEGDCRGAVLLNRVFMKAPDREVYRAMAAQYGFDEAAFMAEIDAVPVLSEEQFHHQLELLTSLTILLADKGAARLEARKTVERMKESELFLNLSQQIAQVGGWKANPETDQLEWTRQVYDMLELPRQTAVTLSYANQAFLVSNREQLKLDMQKAWTADYHFVTECELQTTTGKRFWVEFRCTGRIETQSGTWLAGTLQDITQRKEVEKEMLQMLHQAEAANRLKSQLLANLSHELRTPLNGVLGCAQLLGMGELSPEEQEYLALIDASVSRELLLIDNLLEQSRLDSGEIVITRSPCLLGQCVHEMVTVYQRAVREKGLSLTVTISPELNREVLADKSKIRNIFAALLDNALKFTARGGISIYCSILRQESGSQLVRFTVSDTGIGIGEEELKHIFDQFTQADMSNTREYGGMGLGLSICRSLAQALGGRIWAESEPARGSSFHLELTVQPMVDVSESRAGIYV